MSDLMERGDWTDFRHIDGLVGRGGVSAQHLRHLIAKELFDNSADAVDEAGSHAVPTVEIADDGTIVVEDLGPGIAGTPEEIARLFAFGRDRMSSKYARRPTRGLLGNGLRVVSGTVFAAHGRLDVWTRDRHLRLRPQLDGSTLVACEAAERPLGTRIDVWLDPTVIAPADDIVPWLRPAFWMFGGDRYAGRSSPHWFDGPTFFEYLQSARGMTVRAAVANLARCTGAVAGELTKRWKGAATDLSPSDAAELLTLLQREVEPIAPDVLKAVGQRKSVIGRAGFAVYAREPTTFVAPGAGLPRATIPVVIEAWAKPSDKDAMLLCLNRSPSTASMYLTTHDDMRYAIVEGAGLDNEWIATKRRAPAFVLLNVTAPYLPRTSDGKAPDLSVLTGPLGEIIARVLDRVERRHPSPKKPRSPLGQSVESTKHDWDGLVRAQWEASAKEISGDWRRRYTQRQLFYPVRDTLAKAGYVGLKWGTFVKIIARIENELGHDLPGMSRDPRGVILHPHTGLVIPLGTISVETYERSEWLFSNLLYIEKEGFFTILQEAGFAQRWDCAIMSAKGQSTRAAKDFIDLLADSGEPLKVFCLHDADAPGGVIYQSLQEKTIARPRRKLEIINLGLEPWEGEALGLQPEPVEPTKNNSRRPVAEYIKERDREQGENWEEWLQSWRYELDTIPPDEFVDPWLDGLFAAHGATKAVPDAEKLAETVGEGVREGLRQTLRETLWQRHRIHEKVARVEAMLDRAMERAEPVIDEAITARQDDFAGEVRDALDDAPEERWLDQIGSLVDDLTERLSWKPPGAG